MPKLFSFELQEDAAPFRLAERSTSKAEVYARIMEEAFGVANGLDDYLYRSAAKGETQGKPAFTMDEYDFWYNGRAAARDLPGIQGRVGDIKKGQRRDGGSFLQRSRNYSSWNSFFKENVYQVKRFNDFLSA